MSDDRESEAALRVLEATRRASALGWRTVSLSRLGRLIAGDDKAMPPKSQMEEQS